MAFGLFFFLNVSKPLTGFFWQSGCALNRVDLHDLSLQNKQSTVAKIGQHTVNRRSTSMNRMDQSILSILTLNQHDSGTIRVSWRVSHRFKPFVFCIKSNRMIWIENRTIPTIMVESMILNYSYCCDCSYIVISKIINKY